MSEDRERLRKMQTLLRLRQLERDQQAFRHARCESEQQRREQALQTAQGHYQCAHAGTTFNLDTYAWRLSAIERLRLQSQEASRQADRARQETDDARKDLLHKELEKRLAEKMSAEAGRDFMTNLQKQQHQEVLDLQTLRGPARP